MNNKISKFIKYDLQSSLMDFIDLSMKKLGGKYSNSVFIKSHPYDYNIEDENIIDNKNFQEYCNRTQKHIDTVIYLGQLFELDFKNHDWSKLHDNFERNIYAIYNWSEKINHPMSDMVKNIYKYAVKQHKKTNKHHPEYWYTVSLMSQKHLIEMVCDWHAKDLESNMAPASQIKYDTTVDYIINAALAKHKFKPYQQAIIMSTIDKLEKQTDLTVIKKIWQK